MDVSPTSHHWGPSLGRKRNGIQMFPSGLVSRRTKIQEVAKREFPCLQSPSSNDYGHTRPTTDDTVQTHRYVYQRLSQTKILQWLKSSLS